MMDKYQKVASVLCALTDYLLKEVDIGYKNISLNDIKLTTRIGGGNATYCLYNLKTNSYTITFGKKMIRSKFNQNEIKHWLTHREILKYNYFNSTASLENVFVNTVCHEFSHLIQQELGKHKKGSVHNSYFYDILNHFHTSGISDLIKERFFTQCKLNNINLDFEILEDKKTLNDFDLYNINDKIQFNHKNKMYTGTIIKVNRKTLIIDTGSFLNKTQWKVPKHMIGSFNND